MATTNISPIGICPLCGHGKMIAYPRGKAYPKEWHCDSCKYTLYAKHFGTILNEADVRNLINGWITAYKTLKNLKGRIYHARLKLDVNDGNPYIVSKSSQFTQLRCPICNGMIKENRNCFFCENLRGNKTCKCQFIVWKSWHGHQFTLEDVNALLTERTTPVYSDFTNKTGERYSASIVINKDNKPVLIRK